MSDKQPNKINIDKALERIIAPSVFDRIVKEIDANEIPINYIERVTVYYKNGTIVDLSGEELDMPVPVNTTGNWDDMGSSFAKMKEVKVFVDTEKLEGDINTLVEELFGDLC